MGLSKLKAGNEKKYVAFGKHSKKLGERDDLDELAILGLESGDETITDLFEELPSLQELKSAKTDKQIAKVAPKAPAAPAHASTPPEQAK